MTSSPLPKRKSNTSSADAEIPQNAEEQCPGTIGNRKQCDEWCVAAMRVSAREVCRMHFDLRYCGTKGTLLHTALRTADVVCRTRATTPTGCRSLGRDLGGSHTREERAIQTDNPIVLRRFVCLLADQDRGVTIGCSRSVAGRNSAWR